MKAVLVVSLAIFALGTCRPPTFKPKCGCPPSDEPACGKMPDGSLEDFDSMCKAGCAGATDIESGHCDSHQDHDLKKQKEKDSEKHEGQHKDEDKGKNIDDHKGKHDSSEEVGGSNTDDNVPDTTTLPATRDLVSETNPADQTSVVLVSESTIDGVSETTNSDPTAKDAEHDSTAADPTINDAGFDSSTFDPTTTNAVLGDSVATRDLVSETNPADQTSAVLVSESTIDGVSETTNSDPTAKDAEHDSSAADPTTNDAVFEFSTSSPGTPSCQSMADPDAGFDSSTADPTTNDAVFDSSTADPTTNDAVFDSSTADPTTDDVIFATIDASFESSEEFGGTDHDMEEWLNSRSWYGGQSSTPAGIFCNCSPVDEPVCGLSFMQGYRDYRNECEALCRYASAIQSGTCEDNGHKQCACEPAKYWEQVCSTMPDGSRARFSSECFAKCMNATDISGPGYFSEC